MEKAKLFLMMLLLSAMIFSGCARPEDNDGKLNVVATTGMIADLAKNIGGDKVAVTSLMGPGVDPHLYKASEGDIQKLAGADVIFYNGLHLEGKMSEILEQMAESKRVIAVSQDMSQEQLLDFPGYPGQYDPHIWFDVSLWMKAAEQVSKTLQEADPANAADYQSNANVYIAKLAALDNEVAQKANSVPDGQRVLITAHDAFNYFGRAYGFEVRGLQGISTQSEAGAKDVQDLAAFIAGNRIKAVFVESSVPERNIKAVQEAVAAKGWQVMIGGELFSDAMGTEGTPEGTYIGMVTHNIDTITNALK